MLHPIIFEYLTIYDISIIDMAFTNKKLRSIILDDFTKIILNTEHIAAINDDIFLDNNFFEFLKSRQISITGFTLYSFKFKYISQLQMSNCIYLKIFKQNIKVKNLINIIIKCKGLKTLLLGRNTYEIKTIEHYEMYPQSFPHQGNLLNFTKASAHELTSLLALETLFIVFKSFPYYVLKKIITLSPKLKTFVLKTNNKNFLYLIFKLIKLESVKVIKIYDNTICDSSQFFIVIDIFKKINVIRLKLFVTDLVAHVHGISMPQTIITIYAIDANIENGEISMFDKRIKKISLVLQYIISSTELQEIFNHCPNLLRFSVGENFNGEDATYEYLNGVEYLNGITAYQLLIRDIIYPPLLNANS